MASELRTEYKVVADKIISPDNNINFIVEGNVYVGAAEAGNRVATISDVGSGGGEPLVVPVNIKDSDDANFITFTRTGTGTARIATPQDDLSLRSARDITLIAGDDGPGNVYIGWGDATITPDATNRVATIADVQAGTADFVFTTVDSPDYESTATVTNKDMVIKTVVDTEANGNIRVESAQNVTLDANGTMSLRVNNGTSDTAQVVLNPNNHAVKLEAKGYTNSDTFYASNPDWATGTWNTDGTISFTDATNLMNYLGTITNTVNNSDIKIYVDETLAGTFSGGSWGGGNVTINTDGTPPEETVTIVAIVFEYVYASRVEIDYDNGSIEIYSPDVNVNITGGEDVNITALTDDVRVRANDDIFFTANYNNGGTEHQWSMLSNGTFRLPTAGVIENPDSDITLIADGDVYIGNVASANRVAKMSDVQSNGSWDALFTDATGTLAGHTYTGNWNRVGNIIFYCVNVDFAGYTNLGTGQYQFTLPFAARQTFTSRAGTLHNHATDTLYHIAAIVDINEVGTDIARLYYSGSTTDLAWKYNTPVSWASTQTHFDISGFYEIQ